MLDKLADELKEARKKTGLSLLQVSAKSKIDLKFLEAMEKGNFSFLPEIYVKAFIKDYSNIVDLDPDLMLKKYNAYKMGKNFEPPEIIKHPVSETKSSPPKETSQKSEPQPTPEKIVQQVPEVHPVKRKSMRERKKEKSTPAQEAPLQTFDAVSRKTAPEPDDEKRKKNIILAMAAAGVIILIFVVYFFFVKKETEIVVTERPIEEVIKEKERFSDPIASKTEETALMQSGDSLSLLIKANDTSWVKIILDDSDEEEFILFPQSQKNIKARNNYKITFGNYSRIELSLNNKTLDKKNNNKSVVHVLIDSTGLKYLSAPPVVE